MKYFSNPSAYARGQVLAILVLLACVSAICAPPALAEKATAARKVVVMVKPEYPALLKYQQIGGLVRLVATVLPDGSVRKVAIRGGNPILAECAVASVMKWKYAPGPSETNEEVSLSFSPH